MKQPALHATTKNQSTACSLHAPATSQQQQQQQQQSLLRLRDYYCWLYTWFVCAASAYLRQAREVGTERASRGLLAHVTQKGQIDHLPFHFDLPPFPDPSHINNIMFLSASSLSLSALQDARSAHSNSSAGRVGNPQQQLIKFCICPLLLYACTCTTNLFILTASYCWVAGTLVSAWSSF